MKSPAPERSRRVLNNKSNENLELWIHWIKSVIPVFVKEQIIVGHKYTKQRSLNSVMNKLILPYYLRQPNLIPAMGFCILELGTIPMLHGIIENRIGLDHFVREALTIDLLFYGVNLTAYRFLAILFKDPLILIRPTTGTTADTYDEK